MLLDEILLKNFRASTYFSQQNQITYQSNPHRSTGASTDRWTRSTKDVLGRVIDVATFSGSTQPSATTACDAAHNCTGHVVSSYDSNQTTVTDQAGKNRRSLVNALGQLVRVDEPDASNSLGSVGTPYQPTSYSYDVLGNLTQVSQGSQTRSFSYSSLSRLTSATNPESGTISYAYDANGNLTQKTDARGVVATYVYDALNRATSRSYSDSTPAVTYTYDTATKGKGKLTSVSSSVSATSYSGYDAMGRVTGSTQNTDSQSYSMSYGYNLAGALTTETYPSGRVVITSYDNAGRLSQVTGQTGETSKTYASQISYSSHGAISDLKLGNDLWEHSTFNSRLQPTEIGLGTAQSGVDRLKLNYAYGTADNNGNVQSQTITVPTIGSVTGYAVTQSYTYDSLNRLKSAEELSGSTQSWKQTFTYDRFGNRTFDTSNTSTGMVSSLLTIDSANNRFTANQGSILYDNAGNLTRDFSGHTFGYDAENKQVAYDGGATVGGGANYLYDGDGRRVKKVNGGSLDTTIFVYDAAGQMVAEYNSASPSGNGGTSYLTADNLGTPRIITDSNGSVTSRHDYAPFGEELGYNAALSLRSTQQGYAGDNLRQKFTQKERDAETGLDYFGARYYSSSQGRFTSADEFTGGPDELYDFVDDAADNPTFYAEIINPQSLNKYQYAYNNPLRYIDPDGHDTEDSDQQQQGHPPVPVPAPPIPGLPPLILPIQPVQPAPNPIKVVDDFLESIVRPLRESALGRAIRQTVGVEPPPTLDIPPMPPIVAPLTLPPSTGAQPMPPPPPTEARHRKKRPSTRDKHQAPRPGRPTTKDRLNPEWKPRQRPKNWPKGKPWPPWKNPEPPKKAN